MPALVARSTRWAAISSSGTTPRLERPTQTFVPHLGDLLELVEDQRRRAALRFLLQQRGGVLQDVGPPGRTQGRIEAQGHPAVRGRLHCRGHPQAAEDLLEALTGSARGAQDLAHHAVEDPRGDLVRGGAQQQIGVAAPAPLNGGTGAMPPTATTSSRNGGGTARRRAPPNASGSSAQRTRRGGRRSCPPRQGRRIETGSGIPLIAIIAIAVSAVIKDPGAAAPRVLTGHPPDRNVRLTLISAN